MTAQQYADSICKRSSQYISLRKTQANETIKQAFEAGQSADKWVSVKDRLPENRKLVLIYLCNDTYMGMHNHGLWYDYTENIVQPTHWQPLPTPPTT